MLKVAIIAQNLAEANVLNTVFAQNKALPKILTLEKFYELKKDKPSIVLLEFPKNNNREQLAFVQRMRTDPSLKKMPVIGYGSIDAKDEIERIVSMGTNTFFSRPLKITPLIDKINDLSKEEEKFQLGTSQEPTEEEENDLNKLIQDPGVLLSKKLETMVENIGKLVAFPFTIARIVELTESSDSSADDLTKIIQSDQSICSRILKIANSVVFAGSMRIESIKDALVRIGFEETKKLATSISIMDLIDKDNQSFGFNRMEFWYFSITCGILSEWAAKNAGIKNGSLIFMTGLLHEFCLMIYDEHFNDSFNKLIEKVVNEDRELTGLEKELFGIDRTYFQMELFEKWKLPEKLITAVRNYERFTEVTAEKLGKEAYELTRLLGVVHIVCKSCSSGRLLDTQVQYIDDEILKELKLFNFFNDNLMERVYGRLYEYISFFNLDHKIFPVQLSVLEKKEDIKILVIADHYYNFDPVLFHLEHGGAELSIIREPNQFEEGLRDKDTDFVLVKIKSNQGFLKPFIEMWVKHNSEEEQVPGLVIAEKKADLKIVDESHEWVDCVAEHIFLDTIEMKMETLLKL